MERLKRMFGGASDGGEEGGAAEGGSDAKKKD